MESAIKTAVQVDDEVHRSRDGTELLEEEKAELFKLGAFYPVEIGERFANENYEVLGKLGWGASSTIWFCREVQTQTYKALKICAHSIGTNPLELKAYASIVGMKTNNPGLLYLRRAERSFIITGPSGENHRVLVFAPTACTMSQFIRFAEEVTIGMVKEIMRNVLWAVDFLHDDAHIIHCDIKANNIMMRLDSYEVLEKLAKDLQEHPPAKKTCASTGRFVSESRILEGLGQEGWTQPILADLGEARIADQDVDDGLQGREVIGPVPFRAPENTLNMKWD